MCKFCKEDFEIKTTIGETNFEMKLDNEDKSILKLRIPLGESGGMTRPVQIKYCPFCGSKLGTFNENQLYKNAKEYLILAVREVKKIECKCTHEDVSECDRCPIIGDINAVNNEIQQTIECLS